MASVTWSHACVRIHSRSLCAVSAARCVKARVSFEAHIVEALLDGRLPAWLERELRALLPHRASGYVHELALRRFQGIPYDEELLGMLAGHAGHGLHRRQAHAGIEQVMRVHEIFIVGSVLYALYCKIERRQKPHQSDGVCMPSMHARSTGAGD